MSTISVLTPSITDRAWMLQEAVASVNVQTLQPFEHLIAVDHARVGQQGILNRLAEVAVGDWLCVLDDDDILDERYLETVYAHSADADVVSTYCATVDTTGRGRQFDQYNRPFNRDELARWNTISPCSLVRRDWFEKVGGYRPGQGYDWNLWLRLADAGARFTVVPEVLWCYRLSELNYSRPGGV